jgi:hypothetical protein
LKGNKKIVRFILLFWILGWLYFGLGQVQTFIEHIHIQQNEEASIYGPGYRIVIKNGTKFLLKDREPRNFKEAPAPTQDEKCFTDELLAQLDHAFNYETNQFYISFGENTPEDYGIHQLSIKIEPEWQYSKNGESLHNVYSVNLPINEKEVSLPLKIYKTQRLLDISLELNGSGKTNYQKDCLKSNIAKLSVDDIQNFSNLEPYFSEKLIKPIYMKQPLISENTENVFIHDYINYQQQRLLSKSLPSPHEAAVALLQKDITKNSESDIWEWREVEYTSLHKRNKETVIGLYGDVRNSDLILLSNIIDALTIVIPDLRIRYSNNHSQVNLPIHIYPCSEEVDFQIGCKDEYSGAYFHTDWIFVDGNNTKDFRKYVIVHELGHALGLGHNLCRDSVMSYSEKSNHLPFFSHVDLMQLQILYSGKSNMTYGNNLDYEKIEYYQENIIEACSVKHSDWLKLINFQLGTK